MQSVHSSPCSQVNRSSKHESPEDVALTIFKFADINNDGKLTRKELRSFLDKRENRGIRNAALCGDDFDVVFEDADRNGDDILSKKEWVAFYLETHKKLHATSGGRGCQCIIS